MGGFPIGPWGPQDMSRSEWRNRDHLTALAIGLLASPLRPSRPCKTSPWSRRWGQPGVESQDVRFWYAVRQGRAISTPDGRALPTFLLASLVHVSLEDRGPAPQAGDRGGGARMPA